MRLRVDYRDFGRAELFVDDQKFEMVFRVLVVAQIKLRQGQTCGYARVLFRGIDGPFLQ